MTANIKSNICKKLLLTYSEYDDLLRTAPARYKVYTVPKKSNPRLSRTICQPAKELKLVQRHLVREYLSDYPVHEHATAYIKGKSAYLNSKHHARNSYIVKIDFKNFFNSIKASDFVKFMSENNIHNLLEKDIKNFVHFLFWYNYKVKELVLSIGAPSSPIASNIILYDFDTKVNDFCASLGCVYTRYADDITISSNAYEPLSQCYAFIGENLGLSKIEHIELNEQKTKFLSKKGKRIVTGFVISNSEQVSLGREKKRIIRAMAHKALNNHDISRDDLNYLKGILGHIKHFDGAYLKALENTYGEDFFSQILAK